MKRIVLIFAVAGFFMSCGNSTETSTSSDSSDSTVNSITPPPTRDSTSPVAPMMGDTSKTEPDSSKK